MSLLRRLFRSLESKIVSNRKNRCLLCPVFPENQLVYEARIHDPAIQDPVALFHPHKSTKHGCRFPDSILCMRIRSSFQKRDHYLGVTSKSCEHKRRVLVVAVFFIWIAVVAQKKADKIKVSLETSFHHRRQFSLQPASEKLVIKSNECSDMRVFTVLRRAK